MTGKLARSLAGHDTGKCYVIVEAKEGWVMLADGCSRTKKQPKKKNCRHIQIIKRLPEPVATLLQDMDTVTDLEIKRAIKLYEKDTDGKE